MTPGAVETQLPGLGLYQPLIVLSVNYRPEGLQSSEEGNFLGNLVEKLVPMVPQPPAGLSPLRRDPLTVRLALILHRGGRQEVQGVPLHVGQLGRGEDVVVEKQDGVLAHHLQSTVIDKFDTQILCWSLPWSLSHSLSLSTICLPNERENILVSSLCGSVGI